MVVLINCVQIHHATNQSRQTHMHQAYYTQCIQMSSIKKTHTHTHTIEQDKNKKEEKYYTKSKKMLKKSRNIESLLREVISSRFVLLLNLSSPLPNFCISLLFSLRFNKEYLPRTYKYTHERNVQV